VAGVTSVGAASFMMQGPHGRQFTVNVNEQTESEYGEGLSNLTSTSIVEISGTLDRTSGAILGDAIAIVSQDSFFAGGLVPFVDPATNTANDFDLFVRSALASGRFRSTAAQSAASEKARTNLTPGTGGWSRLGRIRLFGVRRCRLG
jgi:hypothetical protein